MVHLKETPITEFTKTGIKTSDGKHHELDAILFATGFDAMDANYMRVSIRGSVFYLQTSLEPFTMTPTALP